MKKSFQRKMKRVSITKALYIKLGPRGMWEEECIRDGIIRLGYRITPFSAAIRGQWEKVFDVWFAARKDIGVATRDVNQIKHFFTEDSSTIWVTFHDHQLWWCRAKTEVKKSLDNSGSYRETVDGWHNTDIKGNKLSCETISGNLLKVQGFMGTICTIGDLQYLERRINLQVLPAVEELIQAENQLIDKVIPLLRLLSWKDFELLVELVFSTSGWRRISPTGKTQKAIDMGLRLPTTDERAFVQVKSRATKKDLQNCLEFLKSSTAFSRAFFVWHTGDVGDMDDEKITLIGPEELSRMVLEAGLTTWLRQKA